MAKKGRRTKKSKKIDINVAVVFLFLISILLAILIYTQSGYIGEHLSPMLGGIMGSIKYIIPIGTFFIAIYMTLEDKDYLISKLVQYGIFLICIATMLSVFQFSNGNVSYNSEFQIAVQKGYQLGTTNTGGGAIGTAFASVLIGLLGEVGTIILCVGVAAILLIFIFGIKPAELIADYVENKREEKEERRVEREETKLSRTKTKAEEIEPERKETKRERRLREKEEQRREAEALAEQLTINLNDGTDEKDKKLKKYDHKDDDLIPFNINGRVKNNEKKAKSNPNEIEANLLTSHQYNYWQKEIKKE